MGAPRSLLVEGGNLWDLPGFEKATEQRFSKGVRMFEAATVAILVFKLDCKVRRGYRAHGLYRLGTNDGLCLSCQQCVHAD
jgi:hypothetical protein